VLTKTTALGGAERLLMNTLPHLDRGAFDYRFAALDDGGPLASACREAGLPFAALPHPRALDPRNAAALRFACAREGVDLIHAHLPLMGALARLAVRGLRTRVVYTEHSIQGCYQPASRWLNAATYGWQAQVVAVSEEVRRSAAGIGRRARSGAAVVPNGVDFERLDEGAACRPDPLPREPRGAFRVLVPASLIWQKGHDVLVDAIEALRASPFPPLQLWLAGDGPERPALEERIEAAGLGREIHLLGNRSDVFALMARADLVALPSRVEGHPLALLEALALGRPAIATRVGGVGEIVRPDETGLLIPPGDPAALAAALQRLRRDPALRRRMGAAAARDARARFDVRRTVSAVEALYQRCLGAVKPAPVGILSFIRPTPNPDGGQTHETIDQPDPARRPGHGTDGVRGDRRRRGRSLQELRPNQ